MFIEKTWQQWWDQDESIGMRYINRMAIDEDDQFEIAAIDTLVDDDIGDSDGWYDEAILQEKMNNAILAAKDLEDLRNKEQKEGPNHFDFSQE